MLPNWVIVYFSLGKNTTFLLATHCNSFLVHRTYPSRTALKQWQCTTNRQIVYPYHAINQSSPRPPYSSLKLGFHIKFTFALDTFRATSIIRLWFLWSYRTHSNGCGQLFRAQHSNKKKKMWKKTGRFSGHIITVANPYCITFYVYSRYSSSIRTNALKCEHRKKPRCGDP